MLRSIFQLVISVILLGTSLGGLACAKKEKTINVKHLMQSRCSTCHFSTDIYAVIKTPEEWTTTVERMRVINPALMTVEECALITSYLQKNASRAP